MNRGPLFLLSFLLLFASCQRELERGGAPDIQATVEVEPETKTSLSVNSYGTGTIYWNPADKIDVFFGTKKARYTSQNSSNATTAVFKTSDDVIGSDITSSNIWGLYPSNSSSSCNGSSVTTTLPSTQYGVPNTFDDDLFLAVAHSTSTSLQFYNVCGGIKFSLYRDDIKSITFKGNNNEYLAGSIKLTFSGGFPKATVVSGVKEITLTPKQGQTFASGVDYYIVTLPATLSKGFTMTFTTSDGAVGTFNYTGSVTIKRSVFSKKVWIDSYAAFGSGYDYYRSLDMGGFTFSCDGDCLQVEESQIYESLGMSKEVFERVYSDFYYSWPGTGSYVSFDSQGGLIQWWAGAEWLWYNAVDPNYYSGEYLSTDVYFENPNNGARVTVTLRARPPFIQAYKVPVERYIPNYWNLEMTYTLCNANIPNVGDTDNTNCVFHNNLNIPFVTNSEGVINLTGIGQDGLEVSNIKYFFCDDMERITRIGEYEVAFSVEDGEAGETRTDVNGTQFCIEGYNTILKARVDGVETEIAYISNFADERDCTPNVVVLVKDSDPDHNAKKLLNTDAFYVLLGATGTICGNDGFEVNLWWQDRTIYDAEWVDHFQARYIQPVKVCNGRVNSFVDGVDFGEEGSYIALRDLVVLHDWRLDPNSPSGYREFGMKPGDQYYNYWDYYGPCSVFIDPSAVTCDLTPDGSVPMDIMLMLMSKADLLAGISDPEAIATVEAIDDGGCGFLAYRNRGSLVSDFNIYVPVAVQYGWGVIYLDEPVTIHVESTF